MPEATTLTERRPLDDWDVAALRPQLGPVPPDLRPKDGTPKPAAVAAYPAGHPEAVALFGGLSRQVVQRPAESQVVEGAGGRPLSRRPARRAGRGTAATGRRPPPAGAGDRECAGEEGHDPSRRSRVSRPPAADGRPDEGQVSRRRGGPVAERSAALPPSLARPAGRDCRLGRPSAHPLRSALPRPGVRPSMPCARSSARFRRRSAASAMAARTSAPNVGSAFRRSWALDRRASLTRRATASGRTFAGRPKTRPATTSPSYI